MNLHIGVRVILSVAGCLFYFFTIYGIYDAIFGWCVGSGCEYWKQLKDNPPIIAFVMCTFSFITGSVLIYWAITL